MSTEKLAPTRCNWANGGDTNLLAYHDTEWGRPCYDNRMLFELLSLELMQAGLSWTTVLHKRAAFRKAFYDFDYHRVAHMQAELPALLNNSAIIRNQRKLKAIVQNAQAVVALEAKGTSLASFVWRFVNGQPLRHRVNPNQSAPKTIPQANALSQALKAAGFTFVGPVIAYSFMQAGGLVNDHASNCFLSQTGN